MGASGGVNQNQYSSSYHVNTSGQQAHQIMSVTQNASDFNNSQVRKDRNSLTVGHLASMSSTDTINNRKSSAQNPLMTALVSKFKQTLTEAGKKPSTTIQNERSEPPRTGRLGGNRELGNSNRKTLHVGQILEVHHQGGNNAAANSVASRKANSVSKISLLANKLDKIKMYN